MVGALVSLVTRYVPRVWLHRVAGVLGVVFAWLLKGRRYRDPIDGRGYRRLLPYGRVVRRANAMAPGSLSLERHRLLWLYISRRLLVEGRGRLRVLHMAPEPCLQRALRRVEGVEYTSADLESPWAEVHCDICALPFADGSFDLILCNHVLEHIPDDGTAMRELRRVLASGGEALLMVPQDLDREVTLEEACYNTPELRERYYGQRDHVRMYGRDYADRLAAAGFSVEALDFYSSLTEEERALYAVRGGEPIYIGRA